MTLWQLTWQDALTATVILWAVWCLTSRVIGVVRRNPVTGCGTCAGCGSSAKGQQAAAKAFLPADTLTHPKKPKKS